ncbi:helix-turn-helix domain-containing protein [Microbacterium sp. MYb64]|uniref:helix-turn-helix domain-containing protein n=1 Tax=Microbacterium sp. MYb64 TaxID=1848691 RepID=UPI000CFCA92B|nr:helix-turn-helix domain-containing protein [Microbacterium sp. MYb64]PRB01742.1 RNA polymerase subunit sigma-70 [Microbacterium sp. MYb64]
MDPIANLTAIRTVWDQRAMWVIEARSQGIPWEQIADAIGLSRQTVINLHKTASRNSTSGGVR